MFFVRYRKIWYAIIGTLSAACIVALLSWGVVFGIEFTGGTIVEVSYPDGRPDKAGLEERLNPLPLGNYSLRASGDNGYLLRTRDLDQAEYENVVNALTVPGKQLVEERRATVGPVIGEELKNKALVAIAIVVVLIIFYVAFAFRNVRKGEDEDAPGVSSWTYGFVSILVLAHDLIIPLGAFAVLGKFAGAEVDVLIVMALLTILGYSVNDTIVIFDRVRENLKRNEQENVIEPFGDTVGRSLTQTYARSINTSLTTLIVIVSLLIYGGPTTMYFALTLAAGVFAGAYSSIVIAAPLLVTIDAHNRAKRAQAAPIVVQAPNGGGKKKKKR
jgi:preprotein translocase subunit SecF